MKTYNTVPHSVYVFLNIYVYVLVELGGPGAACLLIFPLSSGLYIKTEVQSEHLMNHIYVLRNFELTHGQE